MLKIHSFLNDNLNTLKIYNNLMQYFLLGLEGPLDHNT